ncbi:MAG: hypothetical protein M3063_15745 [Actinomycetota bacterium]|nr:hypothetical protein [Actinomycetota bacterium]
MTHAELVDALLAEMESMLGRPLLLAARRSGLTATDGGGRWIIGSARWNGRRSRVVAAAGI